MNSIFDEYKIIDKIAVTEDHIIYRACRKFDSIPVIIKTLRNNYPQAEEIYYLKHEYEIIKDLNIKGIVKPYDLRWYQNNVALILEDFAGESLARFLAVRKFSLIEFLQVTIQLAQILKDLHHNQIIHQDIKPSNIIIHPQTLEVKITDFNIATNFPTSANELEDTGHNLSLLGTLAYISPEQTGRMHRSVDYRTDFYSLGVTFYEMLTGKLPFDTSDLLELIHYHIAQTATPPHRINPKIPKIISELILKLLSKNAEDRYQSAHGLKTDLETCLAQLKETGELKPFILGELDHCSKFLISQRLYGRSSEITSLISSFDRVCSGAREMVLISGDPGVGKTALIDEIYQWIVKQQVYFIAGKFDQFNRDVPYAALIEAFRSLIQQLLTESSQNIEVWREKILFYLGVNARVIIDIIPEVELIIASQPDVPELNFKEAENRFNQVFTDFISVFTEHPLVLFVDNLQWADLASLNLLNLLITSSNCQHLLVLGAYRANEVNSDHPLIQTIEQIQQTNLINNIALKPLAFEDVQQLIVDTLECKSDRALPLAQLIFNRTKGNPFFLHQLLQTLYSEKLITFNFNHFCWQWN